MNTYVHQITARAWLALLFGIVVLGWAGYTKYAAGTGFSMPDKASLVTKSGLFKEGAEVTEEIQRSRGGSHVTAVYFELAMDMGSGREEKWRVEKAIHQSKLEALLGKRLEAKLDVKNHAYEITCEGKTIMSFEDITTFTKARAEGEAEAANNRNTLVIGALAFVLGLIGVLIHLKRNTLSPVTA